MAVLGRRASGRLLLSFVSAVALAGTSVVNAGPGAASTPDIAGTAASVPDPTVAGPIPAGTPGDPSHDYPFFASQFDLAAHGYVEDEYFLSGTANRYDITTGQTATVRDGGHPYQTRIVVRRPADPSRFNGTVVMEWQNVTNGMDQEQTWFEIAQQLMREGYAWVGVSAQRVGVNQLREWSPQRYGVLDVSQRDASGAETITNDALSYDIFSQAEQAVRNPVGVAPLGPLQAQRVIATGHSQSASMLSTYVNSIQPLSHAFDAFALHGSLANRIRTDLEVPVWKVLSEYDVEHLEGRVRRPDDATFRTWEVAGTSHNDHRALESRVVLEQRDLGTVQEDSLQCENPIGSTVPFGDVMAAGLDELVRWVTDGVPMPSAPPLVFASGPPGPLARDQFGIALGGIRVSQVDVPIAVSNGTNTGPGTCDRWGYTVPFDSATLRRLYPTHGQYVSKVAASSERNVQDGYLLPVDADRAVAEAAGSDVGK